MLKENDHYEAQARAILSKGTFEAFYTIEFLITLIIHLDLFQNIKRCHDLLRVVSILLVLKFGKSFQIVYECLIMSKFLINIISLFGSKMKIIIKAIVSSLRVLSEIFLLIGVLMFIFSIFG